MGEAANISLKAIGKQDTHLLSKDPEDSLFHPKIEQHSEFRKYHTTQHVHNNSTSDTWPFGETVKITLDPRSMGDVLHNIWIKIVLPEYDNIKGSNSERQEYDLQYLGRKILKRVRFIVDDQVLEEITSDWCVIHDNMYKDDSQKASANSTYNRNVVIDTSTNFWSAPLYAENNELYIHIPFFFSQYYNEDNSNKPYFPLCAIFKQKVILEIDFFKQSYFTIDHENNSGYRLFAPNTTRGSLSLPPKHLNFFEIITEVSTLSDEERLYMMNTTPELVYTFAQKHSSIELEENKKLYSINLEPSIPVKSLHWFFRYKGFENEDESRIPLTTDPYNNSDWIYSLTMNRFNFSRTMLLENAPADAHLLKSAYVTLSDYRFPNISDIEKNYFYLYTPLQSKLSCSGIDTNSTYISNYKYSYIYSLNFALFPKNTASSGFVDFSNLKSDKTKLFFELVDDTTLQGFGDPVLNGYNDYSFHLYYTGYKKLRFSGGFVRIV